MGIRATIRAATITAHINLKPTITSHTQKAKITISRPTFIPARRTKLKNGKGIMCPPDIDEICGTLLYQKIPTYNKNNLYFVTSLGKGAGGKRKGLGMLKIEMDKLTENLPTKSAKIRMLEAHGVSRAEIANYLNIRYQHVRNVLVGPVPTEKRKLTAPSPIETVSANPKGSPITIEQAKLGLSAHFGVPVGAIEITIRG